MTRPPRLPLPVPFPVYGLDDAFTGSRNLNGWDNWEWPRTVSLLFRRPPADQLVIETLRKAAPPGNGEATKDSAHTRRAEAALNAVIRATSGEVRGRQAKLAQRALHEAEVERIDMLDDGVVLHGWIATSLVVSGESIAAHERTIGEFRAVVVELPEAVLSITASSGFDLAGLYLVDVRDQLGGYLWPSIREHMSPRREPPPPPADRRLQDIHFALLDVYANATDEETDPRELLARVEYVVDHMLHDAVPRAEKDLR